MELGRILPLVCIACAAGFGALLYILLVMSYRREHESGIERKQRERRMAAPPPENPSKHTPP